MWCFFFFKCDLGGHAAVAVTQFRIHVNSMRHELAEAQASKQTATFRSPEASGRQAEHGEGPSRIVVLYARLSGYVAACLRALKDHTRAKLLIVRYPPADDAPFDDRHFAWVDHLYDRTAHSTDHLQDIVAEFGPDAVLMSGWFDRGYLSIARRLRRRGVPIIAGCDAQWTGSLRQQMIRLIAPWYLHSAIDALWVAGERQRQLARRLGYSGADCLEGCYSCDWPQFAAAFDPAADGPKSFLFVGRYIRRKGIDTLLAAYRRYRRWVDQPWSLICAGTGEEADLLEDAEGVSDRGFIQPDRLPDLMREGGTFILPSRIEPWGVVVQEAATAGLPLLCSTASGASVHLVREGYNGFTFEPGDAGHLARLMERVSRMDAAERAAMRRASHALSRQYTPERWAATFVRGVRAQQAHAG
jgi:glycosyltransferase involved in cell wall biosynthesis